MTPLEIFLTGLAGGVCAITIFFILTAGLTLLWISRAPFFDEDAYYADHLVDYRPITKKERPDADNTQA